MVLVDSFCNVSDQQHVGMGCALFRNRISCLQHWSKERGQSWNNCQRGHCHNGIAIKKRRKNVFLLNCIKCRTKAAENRLLLSGIFRFWYIFCQMRCLMNQHAKLSGQFFAKLFRDISVTEGNRPAYAKKPDPICNWVQSIRFFNWNIIFPNFLSAWGQFFSSSIANQNAKSLDFRHLFFAKAW